MRKLPRHVTVRVDRETADALHETMARRGSTASAFIRAAIRSALTAPAANSNAGAAFPARVG